MRPWPVWSLLLSGCLFDASNYDRRLRALTEDPPTCEGVDGFADGDGDGIGGVPTRWCLGDPEGVLVGGDCDDTNAQVAELYQDRDGDGFGGDEVAAACSGVPGGDCDDDAPGTNPDEVDTEDDCIDQDCSGTPAPHVRRVRADEPDVQAVVDRACPGDVIEVEAAAGPRPGPLHLESAPGNPREGLTVRSAATGERVAFVVGNGPISIDDDTVEALAVTGSGPCLTVSEGEGAVVRDSAFACSASSGAGVWATGAVDLLVEDVEFTSAANYEGSALLLQDTTNATVRRAQIEGGTLGISAIQIEGSTNPTLDEVSTLRTGRISVIESFGVLLIRGGSFVGGTTQALFVDGENTLRVELRDAEFRDNSWPFDGGAVLLRNVLDASLEEVTFIGNSVGPYAEFYFGGGLRAEDSGTVTLTDCVFSDNEGPAGTELSLENIDEVVVDGGTFVGGTGEKGALRLDDIGRFEMTGSTVSGRGLPAISIGDEGSYTFVDVTFGMPSSVGIDVEGAPGAGPAVVVDRPVFDHQGVAVHTDWATTVTVSHADLFQATTDASLLELTGGRVEVSEVTFTECVAKSLVTASGDVATLDDVLVSGGDIVHTGPAAFVLSSESTTVSFTTVANWPGPAVYHPGLNRQTADFENVIFTEAAPQVAFVIDQPNGAVGHLTDSVVVGGIHWDPPSSTENTSDVPPVLDAAGLLDRSVPQFAVDVGPANCLQPGGDPCDAGYHGDQ